MRATLYTSMIFGVSLLACQERESVFGPGGGHQPDDVTESEGGESSGGVDGYGAFGGNGAGGTAGGIGQDGGGEEGDAQGSAGESATPETGAGGESAGAGGGSPASGESGASGTGEPPASGGTCGGCPPASGGTAGAGASAGSSGAAGAGGAAGSSGASGAGATAGSSGASGAGGSAGASAAPVFPESCEPHAAPDPLPDQSYVRPYFAVVIEDTRQLGALARNEGNGINNSGQVAGTWNPGSDLEDWEPWLWDAGTTLELKNGNVVRGFGDALNEAGTVLGRFLEGGDSYDFLYSNGALELLRDFNAAGLNDRGDLVGSSRPGGPTAIRANGEFFSIDAAAAGGAGYAINNRREVVGAATFAEGGDPHAFLFSCGQAHDLGSLGGSSVAYDLNERGQIVGASTDATGQYLAFLHQGGVMTALFPFNASANIAVNEHGEVVNGEHLLSRGHVHLLKDLVAHESCWQTIWGNDINDHGDIVGFGRACEDPWAVAPALVVTQYPERYRAAPSE